MLSSVALLLLIAAGPSNAFAEEVRVELTGTGAVLTLGPLVLLNDGSKLRLTYFPDQTIIALKSSPRLEVLLAASNATYLVYGSDWRSLDSATVVLGPAPGSAFDNGYAGIAGIFRLRAGRLGAIYHAEDHEGIPPFPSGAPGYYATIAYAHSDDGGATWRRLGPVITSSRDKHWEKYPGQADRGVGEPSLALDRRGEWIFAYYTEHSRVGSTGVYISMARAAIEVDEGSTPTFYKLRDGSFVEPGLGGLDSPIIQLRNASGREAMVPHVAFLPALDAYVMVLSVNAWEDYLTARGLTDSGIYISVSRDGIVWGEPQLLFRDYTVPVVGRSFSWGATLLPDTERSRSGWLLYGHSPNWGSTFAGRTPHRLVGRRFEIEIRE